MATFADLDQYWDAGLTLTVNGTQYVVDLPSAELGLWCQHIASLTKQVNEASTEEEVEAAVEAIGQLPELPGQLTLPERTLGDAYHAMIRDAVEWPKIMYCGQAAYVWIVAGEAAAERWWTSGGRPEAPGPGNRASRRAAAAKKTATAAASTTKPRGSTSGTKGSRSKTTPAAKRSTGRRSSATGR